MLCYPITIGCFDIMDNLGYDIRSKFKVMFTVVQLELKTLIQKRKKATTGYSEGKKREKKKMASAASS